MGRIKRVVHRGFTGPARCLPARDDREEPRHIRPSQTHRSSPSNPDKCSNRPITTSRPVDFRFLAREGFEIGEKLKKMSWEFLCSLDAPTYPALVKEFYNTLGLMDKGFLSTLRGHDLHITKELLCHLLHTTNHGIHTNHLSDRKTTLSLIFHKKNVNPLGEIPASKLSPDMRLLHSIVTHILLPRTGRFDYLTEKDLIFMHYTLQGVTLNLPRFMINHMCEAASKGKLSLPYGMVITLILKEFKVPISDDELSQSLRHTDKFDSKSLHHMGYRKVKRKWAKRGEQVDQSETEGGASPEASSPYESSPVSSSVHLSEEQIDRIASVVAEKLRGQAQQDHALLVQLLDSIKGELTKLAQQSHQYNAEKDILIRELLTLSNRLSL